MICLIYTVGQKEIYDEGIKNKDKGNTFKKLGKTGDYIGGSAFINLTDAIDYSIKAGFSVYVLETNIDNLYKINNEYHILKSCEIKNGPILIDEFNIIINNGCIINEYKLYDCGDYKELTCYRKQVDQKLYPSIDVVNWKFWDDKLLHEKIHNCKNRIIKGLQN